MTTPKPNRRKTLLIVLGVLGLALLVGFFILRSIGIAIFSSSSETPTAAEYSAWVKLEIPAAAQNWNAYGEGFMDWFVQARFELPPEELPGFLNANKLELSSENDLPQNVFKKDWFNPKGPLEVYQLPSPDTVQGQTASGFYPTVYIERNGATVIVYITAFTT